METMATISYELLELLSISLCRSYKGNKTLDEMLEWVWGKGMRNINEIGVASLEPSGKSENEANRLRLEGNAYFKKKDFEKALELYNISIMSAPHPQLKEESSLSPSEANNDDGKYAFPLINPARYGGIKLGESSSLSKAYENRSAVMFELELYEKCLTDIELAMEYGYPEESIEKLKMRKQKCIIALNSCSSKERSIPSPKEELLPSKDSKDVSSSLKGRLTSKSKIPPELVECNPSVPSLSNAVKVAYIPHKGRGVVAIRDIHPGELLAFERALFRTTKERYSTNCSTCFDTTLTPLPCPSCSQAVFCSKPCRARGLAEDHWLICRILPSLISAGKEYIDRAVSLLKTFSSQQLTAIVNDLEQNKPEHPEELGFNSNGVYSSTSYQPVYHLCQDMSRVSSEDMISNCLCSFFTTRLLELSGRYFVNDSGEPYTPTKEEYLLTCKRLLINLAICNQSSFGNKDDFWGIFPTLSLLNHSCSPSAVLLSGSSVGILLAVKPIPAGEEVSISYIDSFDSQPKAERMKLLVPYNFICSCEACEGSWPLFKDLPHLNYKCLSCKKHLEGKNFSCPHCGPFTMNWRNMMLRKYEINCALHKADELEQKRREDKPISQEDFKSLCNAIELLYRHAALPKLCNGWLDRLQTPGLGDGYDKA